VPVYPPDAKKAKIQGTVVLQAVVGKDGDVKNLRVLSGPQELQQSALDAVRQWKYRPYLLNGDPVEVETTVNIVYSLEGVAGPPAP
jgi:protein TonB